MTNLESAQKTKLDYVVFKDPQGLSFLLKKACLGPLQGRVENECYPNITLTLNKCCPSIGNLGNH